MKKIFILLNLLFIGFSMSGQSKIEFCKYLLKQTDKTLQWRINGITFSPMNDEVIIYPHANGIDTIYFQETRFSKTKYDTVFSKIPNGVELVMKIGCCEDMFDLITKEDYEEQKRTLLTYPMLDFDSLNLSLLQFGKIKFEILNKPISDTLICVFAGTLSISQMITIEKEYGWIEPCRTGYIDNIIDIYIIKLNESVHFETIEFEDFECAKGIDIVEWNVNKWPLDPKIIIKKFGLRLFNNEKVIVQYDYLTNELFLKFD
jgi:hypothetical protein